MSSYYQEIKNVIEQMPSNEIFVASELKNSMLEEITENSYYKSLERLVKEGVLIHLTKGLYSRTQIDKQQIVLQMN